MPRNGLRPNGERIRKERLRLDLSPTQLAASVDISYQHLANIENGHHRASYEVLVRIARQLKVKIDDLVLGSASDDLQTPGQPAVPR